MKKQFLAIKKTILSGCIVILAALMSAGITSCINDPEVVIDDSGELVKVHLQINTSREATPPTRAITGQLTEDQECIVNNLIVLVFSNADNTLQGVATPQKESQDGYVIKFTAQFAFKGALRTTPMNVVVLANIYGLDDAMLQNWVASHISYDDLQRQLQLTLADVTTDRGLPMWGKADRTFIASQANDETNRLPIDMLRSVAKVDVSFKALETGAPRFQPLRIHIVKPNEHMSVMPLWGKFTHGNGSVENPARVTAPSLPFVPNTTELYAPAATQAFDITGDWNGNADLNFNNHIYLFEADVKMGPTATLGDTNHTNRPAIIIEGRYGSDTSSSFYRVDFASGEVGKTGYALCDILRNHNFIVNITKILGRGHSTLEDAYNSRMVYLQTNIVEWTPVSNNIVFDGETSVEISDKTLYFTHTRGDIREITVNANAGGDPNFDFKQWKLGWIQGEEALRPEANLYEWFKVENGPFEARFKPGSTGNNATIQIRTTSINGTVLNPDDPFDKDAENAFFHILINKIRVNVKCVQCGKRPDMWEDGGEINGSI